MDLDDDELKINKKYRQESYIQNLESKIIDLKKNFVTCSLWELDYKISDLYNEVMNKKGRIDE